ncbi:MAG: ATP-binding cassette domain-containing protein, partial [Muribaculaceae bacterium]|nr:ATP-binding cassette domain-containing protein [Muribaculaceae bacterium]
MIRLQIEELTKSIGDRILFSDLSLTVEEGDKIGIVARNGSGKPTLLNIICGLDDYDSGKITFSDGIRV